MSAESILSEFRNRRKLLNNLRHQDAQARFKAFFEYCESTPEINVIIARHFHQYPAIALLENTGQGKPPRAGSMEEIVSVGLHLICECGKGKKLQRLAIEYGISATGYQKSPQNYVDDAMEQYIGHALDYLDVRIREIAETPDEPNSEEKNKEIKLQEDFMKFLEGKGYSDSFTEIVKKGRQIGLCVEDKETARPIAIFEFKLSNDNVTLFNATSTLISFCNEGILGKPDPFMYIVCPSNDSSSMPPFEICEVKNNGYESILINDFPNYEKMLELSKTSNTSVANERELAEAFMEFLEEKGYKPKNFDIEDYYGASDGSDVSILKIKDEGETLAAIAFKINCTSSEYYVMQENIDINMGSGEVFNIKYGVIPGRPNSQGDFIIIEFGDDNDLTEMIPSKFPSYEMLKFLYGLDYKNRAFPKRLLIEAEIDVGLKAIVSGGGSYINLKAWGRTVAQLHRIANSNNTLGIALAGYSDKFEMPNLSTVWKGDEAAKLNFTGYMSGIQAEINWLNGNIGHPRLKHRAGLYSFDIIEKPNDVMVEIIRLLVLAKGNAKPITDEPEPNSPEGDKDGPSYIIAITKDKNTDVDIDGLAGHLNSICKYVRFATRKEELIINDDVISHPDTHQELLPLLGNDYREIVFTERQYDNNYFYETHENITIASFYDWSDLTKLPRNNGAVHFIANVIALEIDESFRHEVNTGCIYDFLEDKEGIDKGMKEGEVCLACLERLKSELSGERELLFNDLKAILEYLSQASSSGSAVPPENTSDVDETIENSVGSKFRVNKGASLEEQCLDVNKYANALGTFFKAAKGEFCFGLFGHWGRGKTYLMDIVKKELSEDEDLPYETIHFSAWKYRTTPEAWVYLYERFADCFTENRNWFTSFSCAARAGLNRLGIWPIFYCVLIIGFSLLSAVKFITGLSLFLVSILGLPAFFLMVRLVFGVRRINSVIKQYVTLKRHSEKLGLQALIGKDLTSLIIGWIPRGFWGWKVFWQGLIYLLSITIVGVVLFPIKPTDWPWWLNPVDGNRLWVYWVVFVIWLVISLGGMLYAYLGGRKTKQLLLVIDDLDRCRPEQMIEIIESLKLLLEDKEIHKRIQVAVLIDEKMLRYAIQEKFDLFTKVNNVDKDDFELAKDHDVIFNEHIEKLFACYLRLPELQKVEVTEVARHYIETYSEEDVKPIIPETPSTDEHGKRDKLLSKPEIPKKLRIGVKSWVLKFSDTVYSSEEKKLLIETIPVITSEDKSRVWGPRSIKAFLFKYQLSRLLLKVLNINYTPEKLIKALELSISNSDANLVDEGISADIKRVVDQVA
ncbi:MAG: hypothetical protein KAJ07_06350 [Planctomycetes bacterium]|nr:hypothetical protein [Planctomycetota bacterium]